MCQEGHHPAGSRRRDCSTPARCSRRSRRRAGSHPPRDEGGERSATLLPLEDAVRGGRRRGEFLLANPAGSALARPKAKGASSIKMGARWERAELQRHSAPNGQIVLLFSFRSTGTVHAGQRADGDRRDEGCLRPRHRRGLASTPTATPASCCPPRAALRSPY